MPQPRPSSAQILGLRDDPTNLGIQQSEWRRLLEQAVADPAVGIRHAAIRGDEQRRFHVAAILKKVGCHFHRHGDEVYSVAHGSGTLHFGEVQDSPSGPQVPHWYELNVRSGHTFTIPEGYAHQLCQAGSEELVILFACPDSHLDTRDRTLLPDAPAISKKRRRL
jgi:mannose-6-phosphate isomerase-like protein (cupin superfamily)